MDRRINDWLDGRIEFETLTASERERALEVERLLKLAAGAEAQRADRIPDLTAEVMRAVGARPAPEARRPRATGGAARLLAGLRSLWPRTLPLRPAAAVGALSLALGFGLGLWAADDSGEAAVAGAETGAPMVYVRFQLHAPEARSVQLAGSFTGWEPRYELSQEGEDRWTVTLPLDAGVHDYVFVVDGGRHVLDPNAPRIADGFGGYNNRIALLPSAL